MAYLNKCFIITGLILVLSSCYKDNEEDLYPISSLNCEQKSNPSFAEDIEPILTVNCDACHSADNYASISGIRIETTQDLVDLENQGKLISSLRQDGSASFMPKDAAPLDECEISNIETWLLNGAPNN